MIFHHPYAQNCIIICTRTQYDQYRGRFDRISVLCDMNLHIVPTSWRAIGHLFDTRYMYVGYIHMILYHPIYAKEL